MAFERNIDIEALSNLPMRQFEGEIWLVDTLAKFDAVWPLIAQNKILGFDTETKPSFIKGQNHKVALLQLSNQNQAFLIRINLIGFPPKLQKLMSDPSVLKVGAAVKDDIRALAKVCKINPGGYVDLQNLAPEYGIEDKSLKKLTAIVLGFRISKTQQLSNWEASELSHSQQLYAATDAWTCFEIYRAFLNILKN
jgi:ribonuclease D